MSPVSSRIPCPRIPEMENHLVFSFLRRFEIDET